MLEMVYCVSFLKSELRECVLRLLLLLHRSQASISYTVSEITDDDDINIVCM